jgi:hypothetical protein
MARNRPFTPLLIVVISLNLQDKTKRSTGGVGGNNNYMKYLSVIDTVAPESRGWRNFSEGKRDTGG